MAIRERPEHAGRTTSSLWGLENLEGLRRKGDWVLLPNSRDTLPSEGPGLCSGGHGEPASVFQQRSDMNKVVFQARFSNRSLLDKLGRREVQKEGTM